MADDTDPADLRERARHAYERTLAEHPELPPPTPIELAKLERAVAALRTRDREIFLAARLDNMTYSEIAARTGLSEAKVQQSFARALGEIHRYLHDQPVRRWRLWPF